MNTITRWIKRLEARIISPVTVSASGGAVTSGAAFRGVFVSNLGASAAVAFDLPAARVGMRVNAIVQAAQPLRLEPSGNETIGLPSTGAQGAAGKFLTANVVTARISLICVTAGQWNSISSVGTWTTEP